MSAYRTIGVFLLAVWFIQLAGGIIGVVTPLALDEMRVSSLTIGIIASVFSAGFMAGALFAPSVIRIFGNIRAFAAAAAIGAITAHLMGSIFHPWVWVPLRFAQGLGFAVMFAAIESWLGAVVPHERRGALLGVYHLAAKAALLIGPFLMFGASALDTLPYTLTGIFMTLALIAVCMTRQSEPLKPNTPPRNFLELTRISVAATSGVFMTGVINTGTLALLPIVVAEQGWPMTAAQAAIVAVAAAQFGGLLSQWPVGLISDRMPRRLVMSVMWIAGGSASALLLLFGAQLNHVFFLILIGIWGAGSLSLYGVAVAHGLDRAEIDQVTPLMSAYIFVWAAGSVIGPILFGSVMDLNLGSFSMFALQAVLMCAVGLSLIVRYRMKDPPPPEEQEDFAPALTTSTVLSQVDPRTNDERPGFAHREN